jgi:hypothetical protein
MVRICTSLTPSPTQSANEENGPFPPSLVAQIQRDIVMSFVNSVLQDFIPLFK